MNRRAFTLIEIMIASGLALIVVSLMLAVSQITARGSRKSSSGYQLAQEVLLGSSWLKEDLMDTALASVRVYPNADQGGQQPGLSLISAHPVGSHLDFQISKYGSPNWQKHVFYTLRLDTESPESATLERWEEGLSRPGGLPLPSDVLPHTFLSKGSGRTILHDVLAPGYTVDHEAQNGAKVVSKSQAPGGFQVSFLQHGEQGELKRSQSNPTTVYDQDGSETENLTRLLELRMTVVRTDEAGGLNSEQLEFRVSPRN